MEERVRDPIIIRVDLIGPHSETLDSILHVLVSRICPERLDDAFIHVYNQDTLFIFLYPEFCPRIAHIYDTMPPTFTHNQLYYKHRHGLARISKIGYTNLNHRLLNYYEGAVKHIRHVRFDVKNQEFMDTGVRKVETKKTRFSKQIRPVDTVVSLKQSYEDTAYRYSSTNKNAEKRGTHRSFVAKSNEPLKVRTTPVYGTDWHQPARQEEFPVQATDGPHENVDFHLSTLTNHLELNDPDTAEPRVQCRHPDHVEEQARRQTFRTWPHERDVQDVGNLVKYGFFYTGPADLVRCYQCGLGLRDWSHVEDPLQEHVRHSPECPHLADTVPREELNRVRVAIQGLNTTRAEATAPYLLRHPEYKGLQTRLRSFTRWPTNLVQTPEQLAEAGFYYTGLQDQVRCYSCDGGLQHWDTEDEPWIEHARWFPHCQHVRTEKGQPYIRLVQMALQETDDAPEQDFAASSSGYDADGATGGGLESDDPIYSPDAQNVIINCDFSKAAVKMAIQECAEKKIRWNSNILADLLFDKQTRGEVLPTDSPRPESPVNTPTNIDVTSDEAVAQENERLLKRMLCLLCEERDTNILFLPCAHHKMCAQCAADVTMCPVCGKTVKEKVKTFMA